MADEPEQKWQSRYERMQQFCREHDIEWPHDQTEVGQFMTELAMLCTEALEKLGEPNKVTW